MDGRRGTGRDSKGTTFLTGTKEVVKIHDHTRLKGKWHKNNLNNIA